MWKELVGEILRESGSIRMDGRVASERTQNLTREVVCAAIRRLHELGYKIQNPKNLGERHIDVLVNDWWYVKHKKIKTIQNELSRLRVFCTKLGKPGMVCGVEKYLPKVDPELLIVRAVARESKAWTAHGIDLVSKFREIDEHDARLGLMLRLELAFGLRREEVIKCDPHVQDFKTHLQVFPGMGKGGRWRNIPITSDPQRVALDYVKARAPKNRPLGWEYMLNGKPATLQQNIRRYENLMSSFGFTKAILGVTGHGLRAQFAENHMLLLGVVPPTLGGVSGQVSNDDLTVRRTRLARALGHNRSYITKAYIGSFGSKATMERIVTAIEVIERALDLLKKSEPRVVPSVRMSDCLLIQEVMAGLDVQISAEQAHELWQSHSCRHGVEWMRPEKEVGTALEVEALSIVQRFLTTTKEGK